MTQITWKNIAAPDFQGAMYGMDKAAETLQGAFDPLDNLLKEKKALDKQNFETGIKNNNRAIAARLQGMDNLGELNQAAEGDMSLANLQKQHGVMFDQNAVTSGIDAQRDKLRQGVYGSGLQIANQAADEGRDTTAGIPAMEQHLIDSGMQGHAIPGMVDRYTQENAFRNKLYDADRDAETLKVIESLGPITDRKQLEEARKQFAGMGNRVNQDQLNTLVDKKLGETRSDTAHDNQQTLFNNQIDDRNERKAQERVYADTVKQLGNAAQNGDIGQALQIVNNTKGLTGPQMGQLFDIITPMMDSYGWTSPIQSAEIQAETVKGISQIEQLETWYSDRGAALDKSVADATGLTPDILEFIQSTYKKGRVPGDAIAALMPHQWQHISALFAKQGGHAKAKFNEQVRNVMKITQSEPEALAIVYIAAMEVADGKLPVDDFDDAVTHRTQMYTDAAGLISDRDLFHQRSVKELTNIRNAFQEWGTGIPKGVISGNQSGQPYQVSAFQVPTKGTLYDKHQTKKLQDSVRSVFGPLQSSHTTPTKPDAIEKAAQAHVPEEQNLPEIGNVGPLRLPAVRTENGYMIKGQEGKLRKPTKAEQKDIEIQAIKGQLRSSNKAVRYNHGSGFTLE